MLNLRRAPSAANWWVHENLDNGQTGIHDHFMWLKYGFGRGCQQISVDVRAGRITREHALGWVDHFDHLFPHAYADVTFREVLDRIGMTRPRFAALQRQYFAPENHPEGACLQSA
jgi:hypothetical protein